MTNGMDEKNMTKEIIGYETEKKELEKLSKLLLRAEEALESGLHLVKGVILEGAPGVGKTQLVKSMAVNGITLLTFDPSVEEETEEGCSSVSLTGIFGMAKRMAPCVLLLDDLDKMLADNIITVRELMVEMDRLSEKDRVLVAATCNTEEYFQQSLLRAGRFENHIRMSLPEADTRKEILEYYFSKVVFKQDFSMGKLVRMTGGYSCADLEFVVNEVAAACFTENKDVISEEMIMNVIRRKELGFFLSTVLPEKEEAEVISVHEAGHAVITLLLDPDSISEASILAAGSSLGFVSMLRNELKNMSASQAETNMRIGLGGRAAEKLLLGEYYLGSEDDLEKVYSTQRRLLTKTGIGGLEFLDFPSGRFGSTPEKTEEKIRGEVLVRMTRMEREVTELLIRHRDLLEQVRRELKTRGLLTRDELLFLLKQEEERKCA